jgi:hypothetical protein
MKRFFLPMAIAVVAIATSWAQGPYLEGQKLRLVNTGSTYGGILVAPNPLLADVLYLLPPGGGTLALSSVGGWQIGGQGLLPTNPGLLGSTDASDVSLIAGGLGNVRMTLLNSTPAVLLPTQTALRLGDAAGGEYVALVSPATNKTSGYTFVLPDSLPGGPDVRLKVNSISGNTVTLGYTNPLTTGQIGFNGSEAITCDATQTWKDVTGMSFQIGPNAIYSFEAFVDVSATANRTAVINFGTNGSNNDPAGTSIKYMVIDLGSTGNNQGGKDGASDVELSTGNAPFSNIYILKGYIQTDGTTPPASIVRLRMKSKTNDNVCITTKSSVQLITE